MKTEVGHVEKLSALRYIGIIHLNEFGTKNKQTKSEVEVFVVNRELILKLCCCSNDFII